MAAFEVAEVPWERLRSRWGHGGVVRDALVQLEDPSHAEAAAEDLLNNTLYGGETCEAAPFAVEAVLATLTRVAPRTLRLLVDFLLQAAISGRSLDAARTQRVTLPDGRSGSPGELSALLLCDAQVRLVELVRSDDPTTRRSALEIFDELSLQGRDTRAAIHALDELALDATRRAEVDYLKRGGFQSMEPYPVNGSTSF